MALPAEPAYYTLARMQALTGVHRRTLYELTREGKLPHTRATDSDRPTIYVPREAVEAFLARMAGDTRGPVEARPAGRVRPPDVSHLRRRA